jgi:hypothetical protein
LSKKKQVGVIVGCIMAIIVVIVIHYLRPTYTLITNTSPSGAGSVSPSGGEYESGVQVTLTASPANGYIFDYWSGNVSGTTSTITITMNSDKSLTANFKAGRIYSLTTNVSPSGSGSVSPPSGQYEEGTQITLTAAASSAYQFASWSGDISGTEPTITVTMNSNKRIVANFVGNPPIQAALDFFGIKNTHQPSATAVSNRTQLYVVADDGKKTWNFAYPSNGEGIVMTYFQLEDLSQQKIFDTSRVGDYFRISALAYSCADNEATLSVLRALQQYKPSMGPLVDFYDKLPLSKELIGWYEHTWLPVDEWGTEQARYAAEGSGDLRLWFRIWSNTEPAAFSKPLFVPDVRIENVKLPTNARPGCEQRYPITLSLVNNEEFDVPIEWEAESSMVGEFDHGEAIVPKNGQLDITKNYWWEAGERTITYTIYYYWNNAKIDTWLGSLNVTS